MVESLVGEPPQAASSYGARDVVNAPSVRQAIERRSQARGDPEEVRAWLLNHFFRHLIGNFQAAVPALEQLRSEERARALFAPAPVPDWVARRLQPKQGNGAAMWWLVPDSEALLALEQRCVEFLLARQGTALAGKLMRITAPQALQRWAAEHAAFQARAAAGWRSHQPAAVRVVHQGALGQFVELLPDSPVLRAEMAYESQMMRHCLGQFAQRNELSGGYGEQYASACSAGKLRLFSYRSANQEPHITISAIVSEGGRLQIDQIKGKQNRPPIARYRDELLGLLNQLPTTADTPADAIKMHIFRSTDGWLPIEAIEREADQLALIRRQPGLIGLLPTLSPLAQWLVLARQPAGLHGKALTAGVAAVNAQQQAGRP
ncbi:hypothetical protein [Chitinimonas sp.]|uniref:hypothetical protein n=1 Tax=Chitinimonas sp. TaxID=1934313 RepID=UPI0035B1F6C5